MTEVELRYLEYVKTLLCIMTQEQLEDINEYLTSTNALRRWIPILLGSYFLAVSLGSCFTVSLTRQLHRLNAVCPTVKAVYHSEANRQN